MEIRFFTKRAVAGAFGAAAMLLAGAAQAALQDRDLNGDLVTDAFYDTDLKITWLRDANVNGQMDWNTAVSWADGFSFGGYNDWRLPTSDTCDGSFCASSEMGHLWYTELGNSAPGPMTNTGNFQSLQSGLYWSGRDGFPGSNSAYGFHTSNGFQTQVGWATPGHGMAVRPGDVAAIPEPETYALMLAGLAGLALARRQRRR